MKFHLEDEKILRQRLEQLEHDNAENTQPAAACFRLDAGFGTYENVALLVEMGYEVYVKLHNHKITEMLREWLFEWAFTLFFSTVQIRVKM